MNLFGSLVSIAKSLFAIVSAFFDKREVSPPPTLEHEPEYTPRGMCSDGELKRVTRVGKERFGYSPAPSNHDLVPGDLFAFQVSVPMGRELVSSWGFARAICPRGETVLGVLVEAPPGADLLKEGARVRVPQAAIALAFRVTCAGNDSTRSSCIVVVPA